MGIVAVNFTSLQARLSLFFRTQLLAGLRRYCVLSELFSRTDKLGCG
jgi:hypothetical protein